MSRHTLRSEALFFGPVRKEPRTPEYVAMVDNIERVEPLPAMQPALMMTYRPARLRIVCDGPARTLQALRRFEDEAARRRETDSFKSNRPISGGQP